jgi:undecaprenyl-diphosphatase
LNILDSIIQKDKELFIFLNSFGNENWDSFWLIITNQISWVPLYLIFSFLIYKSYGWKKLIAILILVAILITFSDQFVNFIKNFYERLRPNNDASINQIIRIVKHPGGYSFLSGHATTSMAVSFFVYLTLRKFYKYIGLIFIWPLLFAYSRVYLGVHYPTDILSGLIVGVLIGFIFYKFSLIMLRKIK